MGTDLEDSFKNDGGRVEIIDTEDGISADLKGNRLSSFASLSVPFS